MQLTRTYTANKDKSYTTHIEVINNEIVSIHMYEDWSLSLGYKPVLSSSRTTVKGDYDSTETLVAHKTSVYLRNRSDYMPGTRYVVTEAQDLGVGYVNFPLPDEQLVLYYTGNDCCGGMGWEYFIPEHSAIIDLYSYLYELSQQGITHPGTRYMTGYIDISMQI